jgi:predicted transcriptional regulator of viral defense system
MNDLDLLHNIPFSSAVLRSFLNNLKYPKNKISDMEKKGELIRLKRDLYVYSKSAISRELIANHLYGVSYVSLETALAYHGMIPERVYVVRSMTTKRAKTFATPLGSFEYKTVSANYFSIGLQQEVVENQYAFLIATPTKAICDMIATTPNLRLQSVKAMQNYLTEDLRIDSEILKTLDKDIIKQCIDVGQKKAELKLLSEI